ncbi:MAG: hypothetical protein K8L99_14890, partial [Anaerolineae bacterium]|nr:hypothetical protein [Anaerolineae bacterium]
DVELLRQKDAFLSLRQKQTTRLYCLPDPVQMSAELGVSLSPGDPIYLEDVASVRVYRQALHREFIRRRPGRYSQRLLGNRVSVSTRTIARYNQRMPICSEPTYAETPLCWTNLDQVLPDNAYAPQQGGCFLMDQTGKKWPPRREIARMLLKKRLAVSSMVRGVNYYYYQRRPAAAVEPGSLEAEGVNVPAMSPMLTVSLAAHDAQPMQVCLEIVQEGPLQPSLSVAAGRAPKKSEKRLKKRFFRQALPDAWMEGVAQETYQSVDGLSIFNARRLVHTYGADVVRSTLRRFQWLHRRGKVNNPPGFMLTAVRVDWRAAHDWQPAPMLKLEPKRRPRPC